MLNGRNVSLWINNIVYIAGRWFKDALPNWSWPVNKPQTVNWFYETHFWKSNIESLFSVLKCFLISKRRKPDIIIVLDVFKKNVGHYKNLKEFLKYSKMIVYSRKLFRFLYFCVEMKKFCEWRYGTASSHIRSQILWLRLDHIFGWLNLRQWIFSKFWLYTFVTSYHSSTLKSSNPYNFAVQRVKLPSTWELKFVTELMSLTSLKIWVWNEFHSYSY